MTGHRVDTCRKAGNQPSTSQALVATSDPDPTPPDPPASPNPPAISSDDLASPLPATNVDSPFEFVPSETFANDDLFSAYVCPMVELPLAPRFENIALALVSLSSAVPFNSLLDSGCTQHLIRDRALFFTYDDSCPETMGTANCGTFLAPGRGEVRFVVRCDDRSATVILRNCLYSPDVPMNLFSVGAFQEVGVTVLFDAGPSTTITFPHCRQDPSLSGLSIAASVSHRLSFFPCTFLRPPALPVPAVHPNMALPVFPRAEPTPELWHRRFGHLGQDATRLALTKDYATGMAFKGPFSDHRCIPCLIGKSPQRPYDHNGIRASNIGELLHLDICGPYPVKTPHSEQYFFSVLDDRSNFGFTSLLKDRAAAFRFFKTCEAFLLRTAGYKVKTVRMDGGKELAEGQMKAYLDTSGITMQVTAPYAHAQNGKAERFIRTIEEGGQVLLADSGLPASFWGDAVLTTQYLRNRLPTSTLPAGTTPYEVLFGRKPDLSHLRVWGCRCFVTIPPELRSKAGNRRFEAIFVGYEENCVGWRVRDLNGKYHFSRDVIFDELTPGRLGIPRRVPSGPPPDASAATQRMHAVADQDFGDALQLAVERRASLRPRETLRPPAPRDVAFITFASGFHGEPLSLENGGVPAVVDDVAVNGGGAVDECSVQYGGVDDRPEMHEVTGAWSASSVEDVIADLLSLTRCDSLPDPLATESYSGDAFAAPQIRPLEASAKLP
ncbi:hypothetical protein NLJ89_g11795 [Agrocybe chaxingu]|uniref:Integrase catalytic domain-containing protein n=1 Tax=Agrocybe chaxingu TaxID=84603 RepID=A0A9W8JPD3_9AGAR|nr:hypothetical protein NLJ89_g11795 [Agrocybe chaxingu]